MWGFVLSRAQLFATESQGLPAAQSKPGISAGYDDNYGVELADRWASTLCWRGGSQEFSFCSFVF